MSFPTYPHEYQNPNASSDIISDETVSTWNILIHPCSNRKIWTVKKGCLCVQRSIRQEKRDCL
uniref:Uncharacterized protein n=1 Tax=Helianthus annuus TaxID=4232 RepID=A0A251TD62_HELAN